MDADIDELEQRLGEFLDRAQLGEGVRVTERGEPKTIITAVPGSAQLTQGVAEGWIRRGDRAGLTPVRRATNWRANR
jgi:prevent-host-death family protein